MGVAIVSIVLDRLQESDKTAVKQAREKSAPGLSGAVIQYHVAKAARAPRRGLVVDLRTICRE